MKGIILSRKHQLEQPLLHGLEELDWEGIEHHEIQKKWNLNVI